MTRAATQNPSLNWQIGSVIFLSIFLVTNQAYSEVVSVKVGKVYSKEYYKVDLLQNYRFVYLDRDIVFTGIPDCLRNSSYVVTANSDKFSGESDFLTLHSDQPVNVYVGYDRRYGTIPEWLQKNFARIPKLQLTAGNPKIKKAQIVYHVYRSNRPERDILLGGNWSGREKSSFSMYTALFVNAKRDRCR